MNNKAKIAKLQKVVDSTHVSESVKERVKEAINELKIEDGKLKDKKGGNPNFKSKFSVSMGMDKVRDFKTKKEALIYFNSITPDEGETKELHDMINGKTIKKEKSIINLKEESKKLPASFIESYTKFEDELTNLIEDKGVTRSDAQAMIEAQEDYIKKSYAFHKSILEVAEYIWSGNEKPKEKKSTSKTKGVGSIIKSGKVDDDNCDEIVKKFKERKAESKKSAKKAAIKENKKEIAHEKFPELDALVDKLASEVSVKINNLTKKIESKMPYKAQYVLEELIKNLKERV